LRFILTAGQAHDCTTAAALLADRATTGVIADKAYDTNELRELIAAAEADAVIPSKSNRKLHIPHDAIAYKLRNRIERFSTSSNISDASPPDTTDAPATSLPRSISPAL
jgi:transposase